MFLSEYAHYNKGFQMTEKGVFFFFNICQTCFSVVFGVMGLSNAEKRLCADQPWAILFLRTWFWFRWFSFNIKMINVSYLKNTYMWFYNKFVPIVYNRLPCKFVLFNWFVAYMYVLFVPELCLNKTDFE